jgi:alpha-glucosidase
MRIMINFVSNRLLRVRLALLRFSCACLLVTASVPGTQAQDAASLLPAPWQSAVVGDVTPTGAMSQKGDAFTLSAAGADIQDAADAFRFLDQSAAGNVTLTAHVVSMTNPNVWAKAGVMIRASQAADAKNVFLAVTPGHGVTFQHRDATGSDTATDAVSDTATAPIWLRLRRSGPQVSAFTSTDGSQWTSVGTATVPLAATVSVGMALTSHQDGTLCSAVFDHVTVTRNDTNQRDAASLNLTLNVNPVDPNTFHLIATPSGDPPPPVSPFVVETAIWPHASVRLSGGGTTQIQTPQGMLEMQSGGRLRLLDKAGQAVLPSVTVNETDDTITLTLRHDPRERLYGAGNQGMDHAGDLTHPEGTQTVGNGVTRVPFLWSTGGWSLLVANDRTGSAWQDENGTLTWTMPGPDLDLYLGVAPDGYGLLDAYSRLTGRAPIPPRWTFGFMLSRWGYADAADVQDKWQQFRDRKIPVDAFIYDYDWFVNDWDFNPKTFPAGSLDKMHKIGLKFVGIRKPRVNGANLDYARRQGWTLVSPLGTDLHFDIPAARYWWWSHQAPLVQAGVDGWWNDEAEQTPDEFFQMTQAQWDGERALTPRRTWTISRAFAPGMQRFGAAVWTGDINSDWATLANQPGTMLNWNLAGMPYTAQDIGGFQATPTPELYARWIEEGVFVPVMRAHGTLGSPRWPWAFGDDVLAATKKAIELRYRLIPYLYTFASKTASTGAPLMRPLVLEFPQDPKTFNLEDEWLVGDRLLAAPILTQGGTRDIYLPAGQWYDFNTNAPVSGGQTLHLQAALDVIPAYVRAGTILPLGPVLQSTSLGAEDPLEIRIYPGADADFSLYEDDGNTYSYEKGASSLIPMHWDDKKRTLTVDDRTGTFPGMLAIRHLVVVLPDGSRKTVTYTGRKVRIGFSAT